MKAEPNTELVCRARNYWFPAHSISQERGVISYYAVQALPQVTTMASWLQHIETMVRTDLRQDRLPGFYQPSLQILGHAATRLPGDAVGAEAEQYKEGRK